MIYEYAYLLHTSFDKNLSMKSDRGTFDLFRYGIVDMDINPPLENDDFAIEDLGSHDLNGINISSKILL